MALFNESLEGRFNQAIQRLHGHKGMAPAPQIAPEILHVIVLEQDRPESYYLLQTDLWSATRGVAADAAHVSLAGIVNPVSSGLLCVVQSVSVANKALAAQLIEVHVANVVTAVGLVNVVEFRDLRRRAGAKHPAIQVLSDNTTFLTLAAFQGSAGFPAIAEEIQIAAGASDQPLLSPPFILPPGTELVLGTAVPNQAIDVDFSGYVRPLAAQDLL
ncbi:MAG TPA: hypothetical protein VF865_20325 [Acidobacteriaceae bacterium]